MGAEQANPYMEGAKVATDLLGTGVAAYGTYQQAQQAQKQYALQVQAWQDERDRQAREDERKRQQDIMDNILRGGNYAQGLVKDAGQAYGSYARSMGL